MKSERRTLVFLATLIAALYLLEKAWQFSLTLSDLILQLALAWLIAFVFRPMVEWLNAGPVPRRAVEWARRRWGERAAQRLAAAHLPYAVSATLIYLTLLGLLIVAAVAIIPVIINQAILLGGNMPMYLDQVPAWLNSVQETLARRFDVDPALLARLYQPEEIARQVTSIGPSLVRGTLNMIGEIASGLSELLLVLALSYYMMLDGKRLSDQFYNLVPARYQDEVTFAARTLDRTFGGFLRGQVFMAAISGVVTGIAYSLAGLPYGAVVGAACGLAMFIPLIGAPVAMSLPSAIALLGGNTGPAIVLFVFLTLFQQVLLHFIVPRLMSETIGMPSLLVFVSVLVGVRMLGVWGFIFAIPVAAALYAMGVVVLERYKRRQDSLDAQAPNGEP